MNNYKEENIKYFFKILILIIVAILFSQYNSLSQEVDINVLEQEVNTHIEQENFNFDFVEKVFNIAYYYQHSDPVKGLKYVENILLIPGVFLNDSLSSVIYTKYGNIHAELDKNNLAVNYLTKAREISQKINQMGSYYWISVDLGNIFFKTRNYKRAIENYKIAVDGFEEMDDIDIKVIYHARAVANENTALAYSNLLEYDSAMYYFRKSQKNRYLSKNKLGIKLINYNLGKYYYVNNQLDSAFSNINKSLDITDFVIDIPGINYEYSRYHIKALFLKSLMFNRINNKDSSDFYFKKAMEWTDKSLTLSPKIVVLNQTSEIYLHEGKYEISLELSQRANKLIIDSAYFAYLPYTNRLMSDAYFELGDYKNAMKFRKEFDRFNDSISIISQNESIELEISSQDLQANISEIKKQKEEREEEVTILYRISLILILFIAIIAFFLFIFFRLNGDKKRLNKQLVIINDELKGINQELRDSQNEVQQANEELMSLNEQLRSTNFELEESNNTKNKLFSIIAHDLRNSIGSSVNLIDLLNTSYDELTSDERREYVDLIAQSSNQVYKLLENLLTWSSTLRGKVKSNLELNSLKRVAQNSVDLYEQIAKEKLIKINNLIGDNTEFIFDARLIDAVIRNILNNAVKYSLPNGHIYIEAKEDKDFILISIRDEGVGMPSEKAAGIFQSQFNKSTEGTYGEKGTGLGLMICYEFVKLHYGDIWFESEINKGTSCFIKLPKNSTN